MPLLFLMIGVSVLTAYAVSAFGPRQTVALDPATISQLQAQQQAQQGSASQQAIVAGRYHAPGEAFTWRGELARDGAKIVYDLNGLPHLLYET